MGALPAYSAYQQHSAAPAPRRTSQPDARSRIGVVPGRGRAAQSAPQTSNIVFLAKVLAVVLLVVACMGVARVALTTATVTTSLKTQELSSKIDDARSDGVALEASQSVLMSSARVKNEATDLGMAAPAYVQDMTLSPDVVVQNEDGSISLSKSVAAAASAGA